MVQYPSLKSNTVDSETLTVYATSAMMNPDRALRIHPWTPSNMTRMRPHTPLRLRRALTRWESAIVSWTQSVLVN